MANPFGTPAPLREVVVEISVELGRTRMGLRDLAARLSPGELIHMGKEAGERVDIFVNGRLVGRGEAVAAGMRHGVRITEILPEGKRAPLRKRTRSLLAAIGGGKAAGFQAASSAPAGSASRSFDGNDDDTDSPQPLATVRVSKVGYGAVAPASFEEPARDFEEILVDDGTGAISVAGHYDDSPPPSLDAAGLLAWAWERASQIELSHPDYQHDPQADGDRFRAAFQQASGLASEHLRWLAEDVFCVAGPIANSSDAQTPIGAGDLEYHCFVRAYATDGSSALFAHFFDRVSATGRPHSILEPARIPAAVFDSVDGDVYALFPEHFVKGKVE